jgi:hypothetical protein
MAACSKVTAQVAFRRVLWTAAVTSWVGSIVAAMTLLSLGVDLDWPTLMEWIQIVVTLTLGAIIVQLLPSAEAIAARAMAAAQEDMEDELATWRAREG